MKKLITIIIILSTLSVTAFAAFSDLSESHPNYNAIIHLQETGVINGYPDGTFKPYKYVNRAEFLKIILEGSNIPLDITTAPPFTDIELNVWYSLPLNKAFHEGWINGYPDKTFKPERNINKVEAIKIVGEVQKWLLEEELTTMPFHDTPLGTWYTPYISYAKNHNYLEETGVSYFPDSKMTRGAISEVIYRTMIDTAEETAEETTEETTEESTEETTEEINFDPVSFNTITANYFDDIELTEAIPNTFYQNEVYTITGEITSGDETEATVFFYNDSNQNQHTFSNYTENGQFEIPVFFSETGNFTFGIIPGSSGSSKARTISILPSLPDNSSSSVSSKNIENIDINYADDKTKVDFNTDNSILKILHFTQNNEEVTYISRQDIDSIQIQYKNFENFEEDKVNYYIEYADINSIAPLEINSALSSTETTEFEAIEHTFDEISSAEITTDPPDTKESIGEISFSGEINTDTKIQAYMIKPDGFIANFDLSTTSSTSNYYGSDIIEEGGDFTFTYNIEEEGRFIAEINNKEGIPILNHPIYVGDFIPLIPDFFDLNERIIFSGDLNLIEFREELLDLINTTRQEHGIDTIELAEELNTLAQNHSDDMVTNDYFSHINLSNETPNDRRLNLGIQTGVSENIAKETSIQFGHYGLMRSAGHRSNILNDEWERVGLGITKGDGYLLIAEEFSTFELTEADLEEYKDELFELINDERINSGVAELSYNLSLESASEYLNNKILNEGETLDTDLFEEALSAHSINGGSEVTISNSESWNSTLNAILSDTVNLIKSKWKNIGINIQTDDIGTIQNIFILNDPI